ncbi:hypothetical protein C4D60_Mb04t13120 [Musa balbisiana]|uniref:CSC1/OSCA1-like 7TM region domain-containing protein n=1 Tax=Musa balbisiana TaxID=52838 RepID=A0A4S8KBN5_MUSBA|nr:hypothetical protein C4D60_Mb04t13120 [Musa balbisiana]
MADLAKKRVIKSFIQGFLPGIVLKIFLIVLPMILMLMSKFEGFVSLSALQRRSASKYYIFLLVNVFLGSIIAGTAFEQLNSFIHQSANEYVLNLPFYLKANSLKSLQSSNFFKFMQDFWIINSNILDICVVTGTQIIPKTIGVSIPMKATFFITYIMVDGWAGIAGEILRLKPLIFYYLKNLFLVKTEKDREKAMDPESINFATSEPQIQLYFLLGLVYAAVTPFLLPFILVFFALAYVVFRHQIINVYDQKYETAAAFWPDVHGHIITALVISQLLLLGLLSTQHVAKSTPLLIPLLVLTIWFHRFCKNRYEPAFVKYPLQEATMKDTLEREREPNLDLKAYLRDAYAHPAFKKGEDDDKVAGDEEELETIWCPPSTSHGRGHQSPASLAAHHDRPYLMLSKNSDSTP